MNRAVPSPGPVKVTDTAPLMAWGCRTLHKPPPVDNVIARSLGPLGEIIPSAESMAASICPLQAIVTFTVAAETMEGAPDSRSAAA